MKYSEIKDTMGSRASSRQKMQAADQKAADAFVKSEQAAIASLAGKAPNLKPEAQQFNAYMCSNGEHAQDFARSLTAGLDKKAFPVK